jgi:hypothetical protein
MGPRTRRIVITGSRLSHSRNKNTLPTKYKKLLPPDTEIRLIATEIYSEVKGTEIVVIRIVGLFWKTYPLLSPTRPLSPNMSCFSTQNNFLDVSYLICGNTRVSTICYFLELWHIIMLLN